MFKPLITPVKVIWSREEDIRQGKYCQACVSQFKAGFTVNPDGLKAQMEGGIIFGLTAALYGEISINEGQVVESNFHDYKMLRMNESTAIQISIINSGEALGGAGEAVTPPITPAVANAVFSLTGNRLISMPLSRII